MDEKSSSKYLKIKQLEFEIYLCQYNLYSKVICVNKIIIIKNNKWGYIYLLNKSIMSFV